MKIKSKGIFLFALATVLCFASACGEDARKDYLIEYESEGAQTLSAATDELATANASSVAYYKFNEGSGGVIHDETGDHDGVLVNGSADSWEEGEYGNALEFKTNRNQYVYVEDSPDLSPSAITIEMIVKFESASRYITLQRLLFKDWAYNVFLETAGTPYLSFNLYTETNTAWETAKVRLNGEVFDGEYHHIAFCYDGTTGLTRAYFDYWCEDSVYLAPGIIMPSTKNYPLYIGAGFWADRVQQASTVTFDTLKISSSALYAYDFIGPAPLDDNYLTGIQQEETVGELINDVPFVEENGAQIKDVSTETLGQITGTPSYTSNGLYLEQGVTEAQFTVDEADYTSGNLGVEVVVKLDETHRPNEYTQLDGTILYKENDFMICTYVYDAGGGTLGYIVTFRVNIADAGLISVENQMCVNYNIYDGNEHHLALNYNALTMTMDGYIDYRKVISKNFSDMAVSDTQFTMTDSPILVGRSIHNWQGDGWYSRVRLSDGNVATKDMYGYEEASEGGGTETGDLVANVTFSERLGSMVSMDSTSYANDAYLTGDAAFVNEGEGRVLQVPTENGGAAYMQNNASLNGASVSVVLDVKLSENLSYGLHRLVFKDFQYDICIDVKSGGVGISSKLNTKKDGWITRVNASANELLDGEWHQIAMTYSSKNSLVCLYLDGEKIASQSWGGDLVASAHDLYFGSGYWNNALQQGFSGMIDNIRIYNYAISEETL